MTAAAGLAIAVTVLLWWSRPARPSRSQRIGRARDAPAGAAGEVGRDESPPVDAAVLLDLVATALAAGVAIPLALDAVGEAVGGQVGRTLRRVGAGLLVGARWDDAWGDDLPTDVAELATALEPAWADGVAAEPLLARAAQRVRADRATRARESAARLSARLVLPLGLCLLPSFVLLGLVPVVLGSGRGLLR